MKRTNTTQSAAGTNAEAIRATAVPAARLLLALLLVIAASACEQRPSASLPAPDAGSEPTPAEMPAPEMPTPQERPRDEGGGQSGDPGNGGPSICTGERWAGPGEPWIRAFCNGSTCECIDWDPSAPDPRYGPGLSGIWALGDARWVAACYAALRADCGIDPGAPLFCSAPGVGTCWPRAGNTWFCECGAGVEGRGAGGACGDALWASCGEHCETAFGSCDEFGNDYRCMCTGVDGPLPLASAPHTLPAEQPSCATAIAQYCGERCESSAGSCETIDDGFLCSCSDGSSGMSSFAELGGISPAICGEALERICGAELIAPMTTCGADGGVRCRAQPRVWPPGAPRPTTFEYECTCSAGAPAVTVEAGTCHRAVLAACPEAISDEERHAPAEPGQLGALCAADGDCASGVCHFGRLKREGVCSQVCAVNADCPSDALCSLFNGNDTGHCFRQCAQHRLCEFLNAAFDDPLICADWIDTDFGGQSYVDESGTVCISISDYSTDLPIN
jgi:hypothetical protein